MLVLPTSLPDSLILFPWGSTLLPQSPSYHVLLLDSAGSWAGPDLSLQLLLLHKGSAAGSDWPHQTSGPEEPQGRAGGLQGRPRPQTTFHEEPGPQPQAGLLRAADNKCRSCVSVLSLTRGAGHGTGAGPALVSGQETPVCASCARPWAWCWGQGRGWDRCGSGWWSSQLRRPWPRLCQPPCASQPGWTSILGT